MDDLLSVNEVKTVMCHADFALQEYLDNGWRMIGPVKQPQESFYPIIVLMGRNNPEKGDG